MHSEKPKKQAPRRNKWLFLTLWVLGHGAAWAPFFLFSELLPNMNEELGLIIFVGGFIGGITSLTQYALIRWKFGRNLRWWVPVSLIAWIGATIFPFLQLVGDLPFNQINFMWQMLALVTPAALIQVFMLRKHIQQAWLWALATIAGIAVFAMSVFSFNNAFNPNFLSIAMSYGLFASTTGMTLLWLFGMSQAPSKQIAKDVDIERLTEAQKIDSLVQQKQEDYQARQSQLR